MRDLIDLPTCFLICPLGTKGSSTRFQADLTFRIVQDAMGDRYQISRAGELPVLGRIDNHVMRSLLQADLLVADLSHANPNVLFEFGIRYALLDKPFICVCQGALLDELPFDVSTLSVVPLPDAMDSYKNDFHKFQKDVDAAKQRLRCVAANLAEEGAWRTPLADQAIQVEALARMSESQEIDSLRLVLERLRDIEGAIQSSGPAPARPATPSVPWQAVEGDMGLLKLKMLVEGGQYQAALTLGETLKELLPDSPGVLYWTALGLSGVGRRPESRELLRQAVKLAPDFEEARRQLTLLGDT